MRLNPLGILCLFVMTVAVAINSHAQNLGGLELNNAGDPSIEVEPNNSPEQASVFKFNEVMSGELSSRDRDYYSFSGDDDGLVRDLLIELATPTKLDVCIYTKEKVQLKCNRGLVAKISSFSANGDYIISITPVAKMSEPVKYTLQASTPVQAKAGQEQEPNDRWVDASSLDDKGRGNGALFYNDLDVFEFRVDDSLTVWQIEARGETVRSLELRTAVGAKLQSRSAQDQYIVMDNLQLPPGNYRVGLRGSRVNVNNDYELRVNRLGTVSDFKPGVSSPGASSKAPEGLLEAEPNDDKGRAERFTFDQPRIGLLRKGDTDIYRFYLPGETRVRIEALPPASSKINLSLNRKLTAKSAVEGESAVISTLLHAGDHLLSVRARPASNEYYQLKMVQLNPFEGSSELADIDLSITGEIPVFSAYSNSGQKYKFAAEVHNSGDEKQSLQILTASSASKWRVKSDQEKVVLDPGEKKRIALDVSVLPGARDDIPVGITIAAQNSTGNLASTHLNFTASCEVSPVNPQLVWPIPDPLLGRMNAAALSLGASVVGTTKGELNEGFDGLTSRFGGAHFSTTNEVTIDLATDDALTVLGTIIHPVSSNSRSKQAKVFDFQTSLDGKNFTSVLRGELTSNPVEQSFVLAQPVKARFAKLILESNLEGKPKPNSFGEWKVIVDETASDLLQGEVNIADNRLGGYDVYSNPFVGANCCHDSFTTAKAGGNFKKSDNGHTWVIGFRDNRAAMIDRLRWLDFPKRPRTEGDISSVTVSYSLTSPIGPWRPLTEWKLERKTKSESEFTLSAPIWARFLKFDVPYNELKKTPSFPQQIQVFESPVDGENRSLIGEWGYTNVEAMYELLHPKTTIQHADHKDAGNSFNQATSLPISTPAFGTVLVGEDEDWYRFTVPPHNNQAIITFQGDPQIDYTYEVLDANGDAVDVDANVSDSIVELRVSVEPGNYFVGIKEPPRSVVFAWDTSGSVGAYYDVIDHAMKSFANGVRSGREEVNLLPFRDSQLRLLLNEWSGESAEISTALVNEDRDFGSSNVESALYLASHEMRSRIGTRAVLVITDAQTDGYLLTGDLWRKFNEVKPRIFSFEISTKSSPVSQDIMQSFSSVNRGFYHQVFSAGDLEIGFDRATCLLRRPKRYEVEVNLSEVEAKPPGTLVVVMDASVNEKDSVEVILDASGSMFQKIEERFRYQIAKEVLDDLVANTLPDNIGFALRVFGNRDASSCRSDLEIELAELDRASARKVIAGITPQPYAYTPIADSLAKVAKDLAKANGRKTVVLITDGEESCDGNVQDSINSLKSRGVDVQLNVIGFDFDADDKEAARDQFRHWAELGGGSYFDARNAKELSQSLIQAVSESVPFEVLNSSNKVVATGVANGEELSLRPGSYTIRVTGKYEQMIKDVRIRSARINTIQLDP